MVDGDRRRRHGGADRARCALGLAGLARPRARGRLDGSPLPPGAAGPHRCGGVRSGARRASRATVDDGAIAPLDGAPLLDARPRRRAHQERPVRRRRRAPAPPRRVPPADADDGRAGHAPDPRRRVDDRHEGHTGSTAHEPARARPVGCASPRTTASAPGVAGPTTWSTPSWRSRGSARTSPSTAATRTRVVVTGGSAGGHLAAMMALTQNDPRYQPGFEGIDTSVTAAIPMYGAYDLAELFGRFGTSIGRASVAGWARSSWASRRPTTSTRTSTRRRSRTSPTRRPTFAGLRSSSCTGRSTTSCRWSRRVDSSPRSVTPERTSPTWSSPALPMRSTSSTRRGSTRRRPGSNGG